MSKKASSPEVPDYPPLGTLIGNGSLELVEVLGKGGYGVVYRAVDAFSTTQRSYAVKCLMKAYGQSSTRRQIHIREITLHQIASAHPSVVALHRVIEGLDHMFIVMEYAADHDLFTQILQECRFLGDEALIRHVFLQMIEGVQYCHSLGIYHRDLKPENILCFNGGYRVAITDFGLATTDKASKEFRTGSIYHMSPECQAGDPETAVPYSPMHNDIWSLGIILLNLVTGRNPWKAATPDDPTYQAYLDDPLHFLPSVLPISEELNNLLVQTLDIDWRGRLSLSELHDGIQTISTFYAESVLFEGSLARCPWEAGMDLGNEPEHETSSEERPAPTVPDVVQPYCVLSMSAATSGFNRRISSDDEYFESIPWEDINSRRNAVDIYGSNLHSLNIPYQGSGRSSYSSDPSEPTTPSSVEETPYHGIRNAFDLESVYELDQEQYYDAQSTIFPSCAGSSTVDTEDNRFASSVFLATPLSESKPYFHHPDTEYRDGYWSAQQYPSPSTSVFSIAERICSKFSDDSVGSMDNFPPSSPNFVVWPQAAPQRAGSRPIDIPLRRPEARQSKGKSHNVFNPLRFFPRSSGSSWLNQKITHPPRNPTASHSGAWIYQRSVQEIPWGHYRPPGPVPKTGGAVRYPAGGFSTQGRHGRNWI